MKLEQFRQDGAALWMTSSEPSLQNCGTAQSRETGTRRGSGLPAKLPADTRGGCSAPWCTCQWSAVCCCRSGGTPARVTPGCRRCCCVWEEGTGLRLFPSPWRTAPKHLQERTRAQLSWVTLHCLGFNLRARISIRVSYTTQVLLRKRQNIVKARIYSRWPIRASTVSTAKRKHCKEMAGQWMVTLVIPFRINFTPLGIFFALYFWKLMSVREHAAQLKDPSTPLNLCFYTIIAFNYIYFKKFKKPGY